MNLIKEPIKKPAIIEQLLPQRTPMLMVDCLHYFSTQKVISSLTIHADNLFVANGLFREAGLLENMAQTIALYSGYQAYIEKLPAAIGYIGAIKHININQLPKVNDQITTEAHILHEIMGIILVKTSVFLNDNILATAEIKTVSKVLNK